MDLVWRTRSCFSDKNLSLECIGKESCLKNKENKRLERIGPRTSTSDSTMNSSWHNDQFVKKSCWDQNQPPTLESKSIAPCSSLSYSHYGNEERIVLDALLYALYSPSASVSWHDATSLFHVWVMFLHSNTTKTTLESTKNNFRANRILLWVVIAISNCTIST